QIDDACDAAHVVNYAKIAGKNDPGRYANTPMPTAKLNLVTGATGQLGSHIVEQLRAAGENVRVLVRPGRDLAFLLQQGVEIVEGDLRDADSVKRAAQGATIVYHCASKVSDWGAGREFAEEAVTATRKRVDAV